MSFRTKISYVVLIKKYCKNWTSVLSKVFTHKATILVLRSGVLLEEVRDPVSLINLLNLGWEIEEHEVTFIILRNQNNITLKCRLKEGYDLGHIVEIFEKEDYNQNLKNATVIDVGASTADSSIYFATKGAKVVYGIEPMKESYDLGLYNVKINHFEDKVQLMNAALGIATGELELTVSSRDPNSNSVEPTETVKKKGIIFDSKRIVKSISIRDIIARYGLSKIDLLKMDCEGCEYDVFRNIEDETISRIRNIILEFHDGIQFLAEFLEKMGYSVTYEHSTGTGILKARRDTIEVE